MQGKKKFISVLNSTDMQQVVNIFRDENACPDDKGEAGQKVWISLYGGKNSEETLDLLRFKLFQISLLKNNFILAFLRPTTASAREHFPCKPTGSILECICQKSLRLGF
ncbi:hypothetical protein AVEN_31136-1 [Araneus ventricosus]|uniref:Uncharacterized protein n=1 Tax=Araneus ventricosus TaxID=182803 RepID=A0A4Y2IFK6_ARAVE|nr:hypothetical protein AVEN_31136-1 [Araneus ventricosus]